MTEHDPLRALREQVETWQELCQTWADNPDDADDAHGFLGILAKEMRDALSTAPPAPTPPSTRTERPCDDFTPTVQGNVWISDLCARCGWKAVLHKAAPAWANDLMRDYGYAGAELVWVRSPGNDIRPSSERPARLNPASSPSNRVAPSGGDIGATSTDGHLASPETPADAPPAPQEAKSACSCAVTPITECPEHGDEAHRLMDKLDKAHAPPTPPAPTPPREDDERMIEQFVQDLYSAHAEIVKLQGGDPEKFDWPEWSGPANSIRWAEKRLGKSLSKPGLCAGDDGTGSVSGSRPSGRLTPGSPAQSPAPEPAATPLETEVRRLTLALRCERAANERLAICPGHRGKTNGRCVMCQAEENARREERERLRPEPDATPQRLSERWQELFWAFPPGEMRHKLRALENDVGKMIRAAPLGPEPDATPDEE